MTHATGGKGLVVVVHWISFIFHHKLLQVRTHKKINCDQQKFGGKKKHEPTNEKFSLKVLPGKRNQALEQGASWRLFCTRACRAKLAQVRVAGQHWSTPSHTHTSPGHGQSYLTEFCPHHGSLFFEYYFISLHSCVLLLLSLSSLSRSLVLEFMFLDAGAPHFKVGPSAAL